MFALVFVLGAATAPATPPDGAYAYMVSVGGASAGKTTIQLTHTPGGVKLTEIASASYGGADFAGNSTLNLDESLTPAGYSAVYSPPGRTIHASLAFTGSTASEIADDGNTSFTLGANTKKFAVLDGTMFSGFFILPSQLRAWNTQSFTAVSPMFGRGGAIAVDSALKADRPKSVPASDVPISVSDPVQFTVWYDPATLIVDELVVPQQDATYARLRAS